MQKIIVNTENAPKAIGPYSQAVRVGSSVYISGQLGIDNDTGEMPDSVVSQCERCLDNMGAILSAIGLSFEHVVKTTIFLKDMEDFDKINEVYSMRFVDAEPARSCVEVSRLPKRAKIEIEAIAVFPESHD